MWLTFEQPLNEKIRNYLRIEAVTQQVQSHQAMLLPHGELAYFQALFELMELVERAELRLELLKDIERQLVNCQRWSKIDGVDQQQLQQLSQYLSTKQMQLIHLTRPTASLKEDKLLGAVRQRLSIPGGCGSFDLPQLHFWLAQPLAERQQQTQQWLARLEPLTGSVTQLLALLRSSSDWQEFTARSGSYQATVNFNIDLLRIQVLASNSTYPAVSAHRNRFTIHLINHRSAKVDCRDLPIKLCLARESL